MKSYYQILTTPTADTPGTAIILHFPDKRYIFGQISEGLQRSCTESGTKLTSVSDVFISGRTEWRNTGGLIGLILTQADGLASSASALEAAAREKEANRRKQTGKQTEVDQKKKEPETERRSLTIHGTRNLAHTLATARRFVFRQGVPLYTREYDSESSSKAPGTGEGDPFDEPTWSDNNIRVWAMPVSPSAAPQARPQSTRKRSHEEFQETVTPASALDQRRMDQIVRESVVADMFNSSWRLDALVETHLAEVKMPAALFVRNPVTKDLEKYVGPIPGGKEPVPDMKVLVRKPWPGARVEKIPATTRCEESLCFLIKDYDVRGKFDPAKAHELKVKKGPNFGLLTKGESVVSEDGKVITPEMVLGPPRPGKGLAIIDLPGAEYVENFVNRPEWKSPSLTSNLVAFIWILGPGVADHPRLREFVASMPNSKHIVSSIDYCPNYLAMRSAAGSAIRMTQLRPENFSVPVHDNRSIRQTESCSTDTTIIHDSPFEPAEQGLIVDMQPEFDINRSEVAPRLDTAKILSLVPRASQQRLGVIRKRLRKPATREKMKQFLKDLPGGDAEIITLGTGSSQPSKYRNVSSTLVHVPGQGYYLLDCGEGTLGQLKRMYTAEQLREVLQNLRLIWVSHLHADHHLGTTSVIKAWYEENYPGGVPQSPNVEMDMSKILQEKRLVLVSEPMMVEWLEEYAGVEDFGFGKLLPLTAFPFKRSDDSIGTALVYRHCRADGTYPGRESATGKPATTELVFANGKSRFTDLLRRATGLSDLLATHVSHCHGSRAVSLVFPDGFKVSFSGDCRPSRNFSAIGKDSTVMIHEATFQDDMRGSAIAKKHSTTSEAISVGHAMGARSILLTHFSQRYQKVAHIDQQGGGEAYAPALEPKTTTPDIPVDSHVEESSDLAPDTAPKPDRHVPIVTAFDCMRVRVRDMFTVEAYSPAIEKLYDIMERASAIEAQKQKRERLLAEGPKKDKKDDNKNTGADQDRGRTETKTKSTKPPKSHTSARSSARSPVPIRCPRFSRSASPRRPKLAPATSIWDASESESGWTTSDYDSDRDSSAPHAG